VSQPAGEPLDAFDVVVAGAGPAGAATARRLAARGRSVVVLERSRFDRPRSGETLAPAVRPMLRDLGVWDRFAGLCPLPSWGTRSVWGDPEPATHSHLASGYGSGWHVDRQAFDRMLGDAAGDAGADVRTGTTVVGCRYDGTWWEVRTTSPRPVLGRVLVDATGRRATPGRALGGRRLAFDRLVAVAGTWVGADVERERYLLVETTADGWWYTAPVPADSVVGVLMTDADLCRRDGLAATARWHGLLRAAPATAARVGTAPPASAPRVYPAASHRLLRRGDRRPWVAVGDAALAVDPVSGSGVLRALRTAEAAARLAVDLLERPDEATALLAEHEAARDDECTAYLTERAMYYGIERRYRTPFWARRSVANPPGAAAN
jgi:flavin-dependent dehydrogenase